MDQYFTLNAWYENISQITHTIWRTSSLTLLYNDEKGTLLIFVAPKINFEYFGISNSIFLFNVCFCSSVPKKKNETVSVRLCCKPNGGTGVYHLAASQKLDC